MKPVSIKRGSPEKEVPTEILADSIVAMAAGIRKLRSGRLTDSALFLLIQSAAPTVGRNYKPLSLKEIKAVFAGIDALEASYIRKRKTA